MNSGPSREDAHLDFLRYQKHETTDGSWQIANDLCGDNCVLDQVDQMHRDIDTVVVLALVGMVLSDDDEQGLGHSSMNVKKMTAWSSRFVFFCSMGD